MFGRLPNVYAKEKTWKLGNPHAQFKSQALLKELAYKLAAKKPQTLLYTLSEKKTVALIYTLGARLTDEMEMEALVETLRDPEIKMKSRRR